MAYVPKIFTDRSVEFPFRRLLTPVAGQANTVDVSRVPGTVFAEGDLPDAANLNAEFGKIKTETDAINTSLNGTKLSLNGTILWTNLNPTASFVAQSIVLSETMENFRYIEVLYGAKSTGLIKVNSTMRYELFSFPSINISYRDNFNGTSFVYPTGTSLYFGDSYYFTTYGNGSVKTLNNLANVPLEIIGYK